MKFDVKISQSDLAKLKKDLGKLQRYSNEVATKEVYSTMLFATKYAKQQAPVDESFLKNSIYAEKTPEGAEMFSTAHYAPYVEFGTGSTGYKSPNDAIDLGIPESEIAKFKGKGLRDINRNPKPFFYISAKRAYKELITRVENRLKRLT